ncbi:hypothetical protein [Thermocatellispora tengchongensis]|uniref:hypothetical protein n=1 Tax=Thermocatellispora tengchongensis TaxID=1073253 RepID=UPI0031E9B394
MWSDIATTAIAHEAFTRYRTHLAEFRQFLRQPGTPQPTAVARAQDLYTHLFATAAADAHLLASTETRATILATLAEKVAQAHHLESQAVELLAPRVP